MTRCRGPALPGPESALGRTLDGLSPVAAGMLDRTVADDGSELILHHRDGVWQIRIDGRELMDSRHSVTERALAELACRRMPPAPAPHVLVGGLGMGFTLRAALDRLPAAARVAVAEVFRAVIAWNKGPLAHLAGDPLADPRVTVIQGDVADVLARSPATFDAVLLDVDNGPHDLALAGNRVLYASDGLVDIRNSLRPGGVAAFWSATPAADLVQRLRQVGMAAWSETVYPLLGNDRVSHTIVVAMRKGAADPVADSARRRSAHHNASRWTPADREHIISHVGDQSAKRRCNMNPVPAIAPLSDLRVRQAEIIELARHGPVVLVERGSRPALVAVTPEQWNAIAERIEDLEDSVAIYRARWEAATGRDVIEEVPEATVRDWLGDDLPSADTTQRPA